MITETLCLLSISLTSTQANLQIVNPEVAKYEQSIIQISDKEAVERFISMIDSNSDYLYPLAQAYSKIFNAKVPKTIQALVQKFPGQEVEITKAFILANPDDIEEIVCACIRANPDAFRILTLVNAIAELTTEDQILEIISCAEDANPNIPTADLLRSAQQNLPASNNVNTSPDRTIPLTDIDAPRVGSFASPDGN